MNICIVTGSAGLIGSEAVRFFTKKKFQVIGIDNNMREELFGPEASTNWQREKLKEEFPEYIHKHLDIRDVEGINKLFSEYGNDIKLIIHTAGQPSHDWAVRDPIKDFTINANGTLTLLEATRIHCPNAVFIFTSTNKVYGDNPNFLPLDELETRYEIKFNDTHHFANGIDESMSIDNTKHSLFGASKVSADILVQEYGKYFGMNTGVFRGGCLTGGNHSGTKLHGFLSYLMKCVVKDIPYTVYGYKGKQVRDNIHSYDLINMFWHFYLKPKQGEVYNAGGGRNSNCSMLEAINLCERISRKKLQYTIEDNNRIGDHIWYISNVSKFKRDYPGWDYTYSLLDIIRDIYEGVTRN